MPQLAELSEEMIMEILLRLPARTLVSLKSVCTSWRNLISSPDFTRNHFRRSCLRYPTLTPPRIAYPRGPRYGSIGVLSVQSMMENPSEPTRLDCFTGPRYYRIVGSSHGLLCLLQEDAHQDMHYAILWNPCTGFTFQSPQISGRAFFFTGFGYDHLSDTYKVYGHIRKQGPSGFESSTGIYTFGPSSSWRTIDDLALTILGPPTGCPCKVDNTNGVFFGSNGACTINWSLRYHHHVVVYFDLGKETYGHFPLPDTDSDGYPGTRITHLCVLRDYLAVCYEDMKTRRWIVWQMKEYGDPQSWTTLAIISSQPELLYTYLDHPLQPLYISKSDVLLAISPSFQMVLCNLNDGSIDFPVIDSSGDDGMENHPSLSHSLVYTKMLYIYHESLVSPNGL